jgi:predicted nucleic acid-binding Zn ribbon protein
LKPVSSVLTRLLRGLGIAEDVARVEAMGHWDAVARSLFGEDAETTKAIAVDGTTLIVAVATPAWASEIRLRERELLDRLSRAAPSSGIKRIRSVPRAR